ncbi:18259_t:CDS:2 [Gigaspora rosea]|nr:18259_t:CDS:2 [Gigaspora rosea]
MESKDNFEFFEEQPLDFEVQTMIISNQNAIEMTGILVVEQPFSSLDEIDRFISLYTNKKQPLDIKVHNQNSVEMADILVVEQSQNEIDRFISSYEDNSEILEEQPLDVEVHIQNSVKIVNTPVVGQTFSNWNEIDRFISLYAKSQNFVSVIHGSKYNNGRTNDKYEVNALDKTNKFASKHRAFSEKMLKDIRFWTEIDLSNAIRSFKRQNHTECEAAILLNELLERSTLIYASSEFSLNFDKWILDSAKQQFSKYSNLIEPDAIDIHNFFAENVVDALTILIKGLISFAEVISILEIWEVS